MTGLTKPQQQSLKLKWQRQETSDRPKGETYLQFRRRVQPGPDRCAMIEWCGMWVGIEQDGYAHT